MDSCCYSGQKKDKKKPLNLVARIHTEFKGYGMKTIKGYSIVNLLLQQSHTQDLVLVF